MKRSLTEQTLALAGVFQAATLVQQIAHTGRCADASFQASARSLFQTSPESTLAVYGGLEDLREGLTTLASVFSDQSKPQDLEVLKYALSLIHLEGKLNRHEEMMNILGNRIEQARHTADHFGYLHSNLIGNLASVYSDTISTLQPRIQVSGDPGILQVDENAARVRAMLLAGIRSAVLWRQTGGRRWQLVLTRRKIITTARALAEQANHSLHN
ncbi:high frequency lysogenization protein HflD [Marinobacter sp. X15-166B]|uniref:high frequency lysogenization protein HflD n=1 Tax=Marinobacter sp. X15-166B TaxID=1897620 RepID=UPI00085CC384|nr:high frequency lysogenization protein HflD [Marinobacter sp. X15-166B]OEY67203.1 lysogenization regulator HflD [Marinobacter sp. X15-166B]